MYFDLTKKEYKKYEKNFRKTYVGKKVFVCYILPSILLILEAIFFYISDDFIIKFSTKDYLYNALLFLSLLIVTIHYEKLYYLELKDYIKSQKK